MRREEEKKKSFEEYLKRHQEINNGKDFYMEYRNVTSLPTVCARDFKELNHKSYFFLS